MEYDPTRIIVFTGYRLDLRSPDVQFNEWVSKTPNIHIVDVQIASSFARDAYMLMVRYVEV